MRVALYARVSTPRQFENAISVPDQFMQMRKWAEANGHTVVREYEEPGKSATDDRRAVFQQMIDEATVKGQTPFDMIVVHSFSRFFRNQVEGAIYQRRLRKFGVKVESITQHTSDDPSGEMHRSMIMLFDEYQSKENAKHTLRGMQENARQGYYNGAKAPYGYKTTDAGQTGIRGRMKKKLAIEPAEADIVREIFALYVGGKNDSPRIGMKEIAKSLNQRGLTMRGKPWRVQKIYDIISCTTYEGKHVFNKENSKTRQIKDKSEWVIMDVPAIIEPQQFELATRLRDALTPMKCAPRRETSPNLLTGLLKCKCCGSTMVAVTSGKSENYRYYKCATRISKGDTACHSIAYRMDILDAVVLDAFRQKIYTPEYIRSIIDTYRDHLKKHSGETMQRRKKLETEMKDIEQAEAKLFEAIEKGILELDDRLKTRAQQHRMRREAIEAELATLQQTQQVPMQTLTPQKIKAVTNVMNQRFISSTPFSRAYLRATVKELKISGEVLDVIGDYKTIAGLIASNGQIAPDDSVRRFIPVWRPLRPLNRHFRTIQSSSKLI